MLDKVNAEVKEADANIVYLDKSSKHMHELDNKVRLINVSEYPVKNADQFLGFICGVCSQDYDLQTMYVDSFLKVAGLEDADITDTILAMDAIGKQFNVNLVVSASVEADALSDAIKDKVVANC